MTKVALALAVAVLLLVPAPGSCEAENEPDRGEMQISLDPEPANGVLADSHAAAVVTITNKTDDIVTFSLVLDAFAPYGSCSVSWGNVNPHKTYKAKFHKDLRSVTPGKYHFVLVSGNHTSFSKPFEVPRRE